MRHTFPENTLLDGGKAIVVFAGVVTSEGLQQTGGSLSLNNSGDKVVVNDNDGNIISIYEDQSLLIWTAYNNSS